MARIKTIFPDPVLLFIKQYIDKHGYGPTLREVADELDISPTSVQEAFVDLKELKEITFDIHPVSGYMKPRSVRLVEDEIGH
jgi:SOS-response transcriptional repressor LexA